MTTHSHTEVSPSWSDLTPAQIALDALQRLHWSVFPLDADKRPPSIAVNGVPKRLAWKPYQSRLPHLKEVTLWQERYQPVAYAVITGALSGVIVLDFDGERGQRTLHTLGLTPHVQTGSGGFHVYLHHPGWHVPTLNSISKRALGQRWPGLDIRGDGGYAAFCGHNQHGPYRWLREPMPDQLARVPDDVRAFLGLLTAPVERTLSDTLPHDDLVPTSERDMQVIQLLNRALQCVQQRQMGRNDAGFWLACQLRDHDCTRQEAEAVLTDYAQQIPATNSKGQPEPYTREEALASVKSAYASGSRKHPVGTDSSRPVPIYPFASRRDESVPTGNMSDLPDLLIGNEQLREITDMALAAIVRQEQQHPTLFLQAARLVRVGRDEVHRPMITPMGVAEIKEVLTHAANFYRVRKGEGGFAVSVPISPPKEIAEQILARQTQAPYLPFPSLLGVVETPVLRPDGTILDTPGYDAATLLYYMPARSMAAFHVPTHPTAAERQAALALLHETIGEFPYVDAADYANALALLLTPLVRPAIARHVPLALLDAPKPGTGKGLYADVVALIATGNTVAVLTAPDNDEEWDKRITALLLQGRTLICIDNLPNGHLQSAKLEAVLTADLYEGRMLGQSAMVKTPHRATWMATGNNIKLGGDLSRRCYRIRLDPHVSRPWMRQGFTHEDLAGWVLAHRAELIVALLTLARAWYAAEQPLDKSLPPLGTFTSWVKIVGSILAHAGVHGFLTNLGQLYEEADEESAQWEAFLEVWYTLLTENGVTQWATTPQLIAHMDQEAAVQQLENGAMEPQRPLLVEVLPEGLAEARRIKPTTFAIRLGKALEKRVAACFGNEDYRIERSTDTHTKHKLWRVVKRHAEDAESAEDVSSSSRSENQKNERDVIQSKEQETSSALSASSAHTPITHLPTIQEAREEFEL